MKPWCSCRKDLRFAALRSGQLLRHKPLFLSLRDSIAIGTDTKPVTNASTAATIRAPDEPDIAPATASASDAHAEAKATFEKVRNVCPKESSRFRLDGVASALRSSLGEPDVRVGPRLEPPAPHGIDLEGLEPRTLEDDGAFLALLDFMREQNAYLESQLRAFEEQKEDARRDARRAFFWSLGALVVSALSLAVAFAALLHDFGVIG